MARQADPVKVILSEIIRATTCVVLGLSVVILIAWIAVTLLDFFILAVVYLLVCAVAIVVGGIIAGINGIRFTAVTAIYIAVGLYFILIVDEYFKDLSGSSVGAAVLGFAIEYVTVVLILQRVGGTGIGIVALGLVGCITRTTVSQVVAITSALGGVVGLFARWSLDEVADIGSFAAAANVATLSPQIAGSQDGFPAVLILGLVAVLVVGRCVVGFLVERNLRISAAVCFILSGLGLLAVRWWVLEVLWPHYYNRIASVIGYKS